MKLSEQLRDAIDGAVECRGRDSQLTEWSELAEALERDAARWQHAIEYTLDFPYWAMPEEITERIDAGIARRNPSAGAPAAEARKKPDLPLGMTSRAGTGAFSVNDSIDAPQEPLT